MRGRSPPRPLRGAHRNLPTERDLRKYARLFVSLDTDGDGFVSQEDCMSTFHKAGLSDQSLIDIWSLVDKFSSGSIGFEAFVGAMHLIRTVRAGEQLPSRVPSDLRHYMGDIRESPRYLATQGSSRSASVAKAGDGSHAPTKRHCRKYARLFVELDTNRSGSLTSEEMYNAIQPARCGLTATEVDQIMGLADVHQNGEFNFLQFVAAMHLVRLARLRLPLPNPVHGLPHELTEFLSALHDTAYDLAMEGGSRSASRVREHSPPPAADGFGFGEPAHAAEFGRPEKAGLDDFSAFGGGGGGFGDAGGGGFGDSFGDAFGDAKMEKKKDHKHKHHHHKHDDKHHHRHDRDSDDSDHRRHRHHHSHKGDRDLDDRHRHRDSDSDDDYYRKHRSHKHRHRDRDDWFRGDDPYGWDDRPGTRMGMPLADPAALGNSRLSYLARLDYLYGGSELEDRYRARQREAGVAGTARVIERSADKAAAAAPVLSTIMPNFVPPSTQSQGGIRPGGAQPPGFAAQPPALSELRQRLELASASPAEVLRRQLVELPAKAFERMDAGAVGNAAAPSQTGRGTVGLLSDGRGAVAPSSQQALGQPVAVKRPAGPARMACC